MACTLAARLRKLREEKRLTQEQVAAAIHVTRGLISMYENDLRQPAPVNVTALARFYGVTTDYLLCADERRFVDVSGLNEAEIAAIETMVSLLRTK